MRALPGNAGPFRSDISCTLFLSEPGEYDGGDLIINDTCGEHGVTLPADDLIIYPSGSLHQVTPVTCGSRVAPFFWVQSLIREDARRRMLFDMDVVIQKLPESRSSDSDAVVSVTGV